MRAFPSMDLILTNSNYTRDNILKITSGQVSNIQTCYFGIDKIENSIQGTNEDVPFILGFASPLVVLKNPLTIIESAHILINKMKIKVRVKLIGSGHDMQLIHSRVEQYDLGEHVEVIASISDPSLRSMMKNAAACLYIPLGESFGIVPLEAMALGTPAVVSRYGGPAETVIDGVTGFLVDPFSPEDIAAKCRHLLTRPENMKSMGEKGRDHVKRNFSTEKFIFEFENHLVQCLGFNNK